MKLSFRTTDDGRYVGTLTPDQPEADAKKTGYFVEAKPTTHEDRLHWHVRGFVRGHQIFSFRATTPELLRERAQRAMDEEYEMNRHVALPDPEGTVST